MAFMTGIRAMMAHEIAAADVDGLLRGTGQLDDLREAIEDQRRAGELAHPGRPWETHHEMRFALAYFWNAQAYIFIARSLKEVDDADDPGTVGYMPRVSHDQAIALLKQSGTYLATAYEALANPAFGGNGDLPAPLAPRIDAESRCPVVHLKGMLKGTEYLRNFAEVEVGRYVTAVAAAADAPRDVKDAANGLKGELAKAQSRLRLAEGAVNPILNGELVDDETHEEAENNLWNCLASLVWLGQVVAMPSLLSAHAMPDAGGTRQGHTAPPAPFGGSLGVRHIDRSERWLLTDGTARSRLQREGRTRWAEDELDELWENKNWTLSPDEQRFLAAVQQLQRDGSVRPTSYMAECPYDPVWTTLRSITLMGQQLGAGRQLAYNHHDGKGELLTSFRDAPDFEECAGDDD